MSFHHPARGIASLAFTVCLCTLPACGGDGDEASSSSAGGGSSGSTGSTGTGGTTNAPTCAPPSGAPDGFQVSPTGAPGGDGSAERPWDLATALDHPAAVQPGDTIWLRGGVYAGTFVSKLDGMAGAPITVRSYPGEWAILDSQGSAEPTLQIYHGWTAVQDLEIMNSDPTRLTTGRASGVYVEGDHIQLIHVVVHDVGTGIICNSATDSSPELAPELEVYGSILYNNGWQDGPDAHGHHLYLQNRDGTKHVLDNIIFNAFAFGIHAYSDSDTYYAQGYEIAGNVWFQNGAASPGLGKHYDDCMVGHNGTHPVSRLVLRENHGWASVPDERDVRLGWDAPNEDAQLVDNYIVGQTIFQPSWASVEMNGNTFYGPLTGVDPAQHPDNMYLSQRPTGARIVVRPSQRQPGRAHLIVYNWDLADTVDVDLGTALPVGATYEIRSALAILGPPVLAGTYEGGSVALPMTGTAVAQPIGIPDAILPEETPGKEFGAFVLISCGGP